MIRNADRHVAAAGALRHFIEGVAPTGMKG